VGSTELRDDGDFRGDSAAASLKPFASNAGRSHGIDFRGDSAAASLKHAVFQRMEWA